ncbi:MAG: rod shape-determining protein MreD [Coriobacteriia bacterium]|nr:rod shape-determining protein MreD [Coriobacteriia bacterium]
MNRSWTTAGALAVAVVMQVMLAPHLAIGNIMPNFPLLVVVTLAFVEGPSAGAVAGFVAGLLLDLLSTGPVGAWALVLTATGYTAGMLQENLFAEGWLAPVTVAIVAGFVADFSYLVVVAILGVGPAFWESLGQAVLPRAVYNAVLVMLAYPWLARFLRSDRSMKSFRRVA